MLDCASDAFRLPRVCRRLLAIALSLVGLANGEETRPVVGPGATRDEAIEAYGWPSGQSQSAGKEILTYPQGRIVLQNGVVERVDFSPNVVWAKPKPRPAAPTPTKPAPIVRAAPPALPDAWGTDYPAALRAAAARSSQVLVLFTGTDWSPLAKRFEAEVARHPEFLKAVTPEFVLLKLDFRTHSVLPAGQEKQNTGLRERFNVTTYPTLLILSAAGEEVSRVNLSKSRTESTFRGQVIAAIQEARPQPATVVEWRERPAAAAVPPPAGWHPWSIASIAALVILVVGWYLVRRMDAAAIAPSTEGRVPTPAQLAVWPYERLRDVVAALFEFEGWRVQLRAREGGGALALRRGADERPRVLVGIQPADVGLAGAPQIRNLFAAVVAEGIETAWYVSPGGFAPAAREFAAEHGIVLIGGEDLLERLTPLPPLALLRVVGPAD